MWKMFDNSILTGSRTIGLLAPEVQKAHSKNAVLLGPHPCIPPEEEFVGKNMYPNCKSNAPNYGLKEVHCILCAPFFKDVKTQADYDRKWEKVEAELAQHGLGDGPSRSG